MSDKVEMLIRELLWEVGEDPNREGLVETPKRVSNALKEMCKGNGTPNFDFNTFS